MRITLLTLTYLLLSHLSAQNTYYLDVSNQLPIQSSPGMDVQAADLDNDGDLDIILANEFQPNQILFNDGSGTFTDMSLTNLPQVTHDSEDIAVADFDKDGDLDIVFCSEDDVIHEFYLNDGSGKFSLGAGRLPNSTANAVLTADFNGDMYPDLIFGNAGQNRLLINDSTGHFIDETASRLPTINDITQDLQLADVDKDGDLDLFVGNEDRNRLLINDGAGTFSDETNNRLPAFLNTETRKATFGDVDKDGDLDIFLSNVAFNPAKNLQNRLLINDGTGRFADQTVARLPMDNDHTLDGIFVDIDLDGDLDLITSNIPLRPYKALMNIGNGIFRDSSSVVFPSPINGDGLGLLAADLDGDGLKDLYLCNRGQQDRLLQRNPAVTALDDELTNHVAITFAADPFFQTLWIEHDLPKRQALKIEVLNAIGQAILPTQATVLAPGQKFPLELPSLPAGTYMVQVDLGYQTYSRRIRRF